MASFDVAGALQAGYSPTEVANELGSQNDFDVGAARKAGYSDAEILDHFTSSQHTLPADAPPGGASWGDTIQGGLHDLGENTANALGAVGLSGAGHWLQSNTIADPTAGQAAPSPYADIQQGNYGAAASDTAKRIARGALGYAPAVAAGGAGALAGAAATLPLALGANAGENAAKNGRDLASPSDLTAGVIGKTAADTAVGGFGAGADGVLSRIGRAASGNIADTQAHSLIDTGQLANTQQTADAGIVGAGAGAGFEAIPGARKAFGEGVNRLTAPDVSDLSQAELQSIDRVNQSFQALQKSNPRASDQANLNSLKADTQQQLLDRVSSWKDADLIDTADVRSLKTLINNQALRANNTITDGRAGVASLFDGVDDLSNVPDNERAAFKNTVLDLNTLAPQSFQNRGTGPLQRIGRAVGSVAPALAGADLMGLTGAAMGLGGGGVGAEIGGKIGQWGDRLIGTNLPPVVAQRMASQRAMRAQGMQPGTYGGVGEGLQQAARYNAANPAPYTGPTVADLNPTQPGVAADSGKGPMTINSPAQMGSDASMWNTLKQASAPPPEPPPPTVSQLNPTQPGVPNSKGPLNVQVNPPPANDQLDQMLTLARARRLADMGPAPAAQQTPQASSGSPAAPQAPSAPASGMSPMKWLANPRGLSEDQAAQHFAEAGYPPEQIAAMRTPGYVDAQSMLPHAAVLSQQVANSGGPNPSMGAGKGTQDNLQGVRNRLAYQTQNATHTSIVDTLNNQHPELAQYTGVLAQVRGGSNRQALLSQWAQKAIQDGDAALAKSLLDNLGPLAQAVN